MRQGYGREGYDGGMRKGNEGEVRGMRDRENCEVETQKSNFSSVMAVE